MSRSRSTAILALMVAGLSAPRLLAAQRVTREFGVSAVQLEEDRGSFTSVGLSAALRPTSRARIAAYAGLGRTSTDETVGRVEGVAHLLLASGRRTGVGWYAGGGIGADISDHADTWLIGLVGAEGGPGARSGWALEAGVGGGWRFSAGWRWRR